MTPLPAQTGSLDMSTATTSISDSELVQFLAKACGCKRAGGRPCYTLLPKQHYQEIRWQCAELTRNELGTVLLGQNMATMMNDTMTQDTKFRHTPNAEDAIFDGNEAIHTHIHCTAYAHTFSIHTHVHVHTVSRSQPTSTEVGWPARRALVHTHSNSIHFTLKSVWVDYSVCGQMQGGWSPCSQILDLYGTVEAADTKDKGDETDVRPVLGQVILTCKARPLHLSIVISSGSSFMIVAKRAHSTSNLSSRLDLHSR